MNLLQRIAGAAETLESELLGRRFASVRAVLDASAWMPDGPDRYCRRCGASVGPGEVTPTGCGRCRRSRVPWEEVTRLGLYAGDLAAWIRLAKYQGWTEMATELGGRLGDAILHGSRIDLERALVVPMPMPRLRRLVRGADHAAVMAGACAARLGLPCQSVLWKKEGRTQASLTITERSRAGGMGIRCRPWCRWAVRGWHVLVVDDVLTTGATMRSAARLLTGAGAASVHVAVASVSSHKRLKNNHLRRKP
jgi:predicted amidophosphoribosyltransferase